MSFYTYKACIYFHHTDAGGIVYHGNYLALAEEARTVWQQSFGLPEYDANMMVKNNETYVVRSVKIDYLRPAFLADKIEIRCSVLRIDGASVTFLQEFWRENVKLTVVEIKVAILNTLTGRPVRFPSQLKDKYLEYMYEPEDK